jgi:hypothetical protein
MVIFNILLEQASKSILPTWRPRYPKTMGGSRGVKPPNEANKAFVFNDYFEIVVEWC